MAKIRLSEGKKKIRSRKNQKIVSPIKRETAPDMFVIKLAIMSKSRFPSPALTANGANPNILKGGRATINSIQRQERKPMMPVCFCDKQADTEMSLVSAKLDPGGEGGEKPGGQQERRSPPLQTNPTML